MIEGEMNSRQQPQSAIGRMMTTMLRERPAARIYMSDGQGHVVEVTNATITMHDFVVETTDEIVRTGSIILHS